MSAIKSSVKRLFSTFGYEITSRSKEKVRIENFKNLVSAYEYQLNSRADASCPSGNPLRTRLLG